VLISGLITAKGAPRGLLWLWLDGSFELIVCPVLLAELERVLLRPKFRPYVTVQEVRAYVALLQRLSSVEPDPEVTAGSLPIQVMTISLPWLAPLERMSSSPAIHISRNPSKRDPRCSLRESF
jgi:hypothetical protein